jgi:uncharacterized protein YdaU (DUF1376 family)
MRLNWVKWYFTDWMIGVRRMSWSARGIYMEALCLQFHGERLPVGMDAWSILFPGITEADYAQVVERFEMRTDARGDHLVNRRLEQEMQGVGERRNKAKQAAAKRWSCSSNAEALPREMHEQSGSNAIRREEKREEEKREEEVSTGSGGKGAREIINLADEAEESQTKRTKLRMPEGALEAIWEMFPKRVGKKSAIALLERAIRDYAKEWELDALDDACDWMRERVEEMAKRYDGTDEKFIPHPATWLRQGRYEDPVEEVAQ